MFDINVRNGFPNQNESMGFPDEKIGRYKLQSWVRLGPSVTAGVTRWRRWRRPWPAAGCRAGSLCSAIMTVPRLYNKSTNIF